MSLTDKERHRSIKWLLEVQAARNATIPEIILEGIKLSESEQRIIDSLFSNGHQWVNGKLIQIGSNVVSILT